MASSGVTPLAEGVTTLTAYDGAANQASTFIAQDQPDLLTLVSTPASGSFVGVTAAVPFSLRVLLADGVTPSANRSVTIAATNQNATFGVCAGAALCTLTTDANGMITTSVLPTGAGIVTLVASDRTVQLAASFTTAVKPDQLLLVSAPSGTITLGQTAAPAFAVRLLDGFGKPLAGRAIQFAASAGSVLWSACPLPACTVLSGADGSAAITAVPVTAGNVVLTATSGTQSQTALLLGAVPPDALALISLPANGSFPGSFAAVPFAVQVLAGYPSRPTPGKSATVAVTQGSALLAACGQPTCTLRSDAAGVVSTTIEPLAAGPVTLLAQEAGASLSGTFTAVVNRAVLVDGSALPLQIHPGDTVTLRVQALTPVGLRPDAGLGLDFSLLTGSATLGNCTGTVCSVTTDTQGFASVTVVAGALGTLSLLVTQTGVANSQQLPLLLRVVPLGYTITSTPSHLYVAEQVAFSFDASAQIVQGQVPVAALPVAWSGSSGFSAAGSSILTGSSGTASVQATAGPLAAGSTVSLTACVVTTVCTALNASGVSADLFQAAFVSGAHQTVSVGAAYANIVASVNDDAAHPVAGAEVMVYQTVTSAAQPCPARGRCPAAAVLAKRVTVTRSDVNGLITLTPLTQPGTAAQTEIALVAGSHGFATTVLSTTP